MKLTRNIYNRSAQASASSETEFEQQTVGVASSSSIPLRPSFINRFQPGLKRRGLGCRA
ncbi:MAG: hypothetical protein AAFU71_18070 [Cyanobacteria bacterium J06632_22]